MLQVLIRRHENIKRSIGVSVPIPVDSTTVMKAIWESLLLRGKDAEQLTLDFGEATSKSPAEQVEVEWTNAAEREKASRTRFRQAGLKPDTVEHALTEVRRALGGPADVETFTCTALSILGAPVSDTDDGFTAIITALPSAVRDQLPPTRHGENHTAYTQRRVDEGWPEPTPFTNCDACRYARHIVAYESVGWVVPPPKKPRQPPRKRNEEEILQEKVKKAERDLARLQKELKEASDRRGAPNADDIPQGDPD